MNVSYNDIPIEWYNWLIHSGPAPTEEELKRRNQEDIQKL
jgi:NADH:ubiquinone oxidoreductase subunit